MRYALIDSGRRLVAIDDVESPDDWGYPDGYSLVECGGFEPDHDMADYIWDGTRFAYSPPSMPLDPLQVFGEMFAASPGLTVGIADATARRMKPYLPAYDPMADYPEGALVTRGGSACRKTRTGWREIG